MREEWERSRIDTDKARDAMCNAVREKKMAAEKAEREMIVRKEERSRAVEAELARFREENLKERAAWKIREAEWERVYDRALERGLIRWRSRRPRRRRRPRPARLRPHRAEARSSAGTTLCRVAARPPARARTTAAWCRTYTLIVCGP